MKMIRTSMRLIHTSRWLLQSAPEGTSTALPQKVLGKGKKKAPEKQNLVILNAKQSKLYKRKGHRSQENTVKKLDDLDLSQIQETTSKLLNIFDKSQVFVTDQELCDTVNAHKPVNLQMSKQRYIQITNELSSAFTLKQIRRYIFKELSSLYAPKKWNKAQLIDAIVQKGWNCKISKVINPSDDLIQTRSFFLTKKKMFLLMSHSSIVQNWMRANVRIVLFPTSLQLVISANEAHLQYIELALDSLFNNAKEQDVDLESVEQLFAITGETLPLEDIQRLSSVYFEKKNGDEPHLYTMSSLGDRKFTEAKRLILWSLDYNPFMKAHSHIDTISPNVKYFKTFADQSFPWIHRKKNWYRLKEPKTINSKTDEIKIDSNEIYKELNSEPSKQVSFKLEDPQDVVAVAFGQLLQSSNKGDDPKNKTIFNTEIPFIHEKVLKLPLYDSEGEQIDTTVDNHTYYAQIKLLPSPFNKSNSYLEYPPIEFWFDIDERESVKKDTLQVLCITNDQISNVSVPQSITDLKFVKSQMTNLIDGYRTDDNWLKDQPGIREFLMNAKLNFNGQEKIFVPDYVDIKLPGSKEPVRYDYITMCHRKQLDLRYHGRLVTYAVIEGGSLGGSTSEVIMVGNADELNEEGFNSLVSDAISFAKDLGE